MHCSLVFFTFVSNNQMYLCIRGFWKLINQNTLHVEGKEHEKREVVMGISGIGSQITYIYNSQTRKLATKDGSKDAFVDYFNGDISKDDNDSLNGFDAGRKNDIEKMLWFYSLDENSNIFHNTGKTEFEITAEWIDAAEASYSIDGKKAFTVYHMGFFNMIDQAELNKVLREKLLAKCNEKYNETSNQDSGVNGIKDEAKNAVPANKSEEGNRRFAIPAWLGNRALREYEEWLSIPLSERKSAGYRR